MNEVLRERLVKAAAGGAIAVAGVLQSWYESGDRQILTAYLDPAGILTVCDGVTGSDVIRGKTYTPDECAALKKKHSAIAEAGVKRQINAYDKLNVWQQAALIDFTYNVGEGKLQGSTMRRYFNSGQTVAGCNELVKWNKTTQAGKLVPLPGLTDRRGTEMDLCLNWGAIYK